MYGIRFGPKNLSKKGQRRTNSRKIISARRVTSDLALDSNKLNIVNAEAVYTEVGRKTP
jgi:hypothetical protein